MFKSNKRGDNFSFQGRSCSRFFKDKYIHAYFTFHHRRRVQWSLVDNAQHACYFLQCAANCHRITQSTDRWSSNRGHLAKNMGAYLCGFNTFARSIISDYKLRRNVAIGLFGHDRLLSFASVDGFSTYIILFFFFFFRIEIARQKSFDDKSNFC